MTNDGLVSKFVTITELKRLERKILGKVALMIHDSEKRLVKLIKQSQKEIVELITKSTIEMIAQSQKEIVELITKSTIEMIAQSKKETIAEIIDEFHKAYEEDATHRFSHSRINDDLEDHDVRIVRLEKVI